MASKWLGRMTLGALVLGTVSSSGAVVGCAEEREPINRVQGNVIPKSFLVGQKYSDPSDDPEFHARTMVIDVPYGESGADWGLFTNSINTVSKIKWSFEGNGGEWLVGRVSFERIDGTDGKGLEKPKDAKRDPSLPVAQNDGIVIYQFRVQSHFDIRRAYNAGTGEEQNVLEENAVDRKWQDRDYVRVDFSENRVTTAYDFDTMSLLGIYGGIDYTSAPLYVENPKDPSAPVIDVENSYMDVTNKVFAAPKMLDVWGMHFPGCMLPNIISGGTEPVGNCNPNEVTLRHSFKRVVDNDYEPMDWDGRRFQAYGAFTTQRNGYARDYGAVDAKWKRYISRYNVWERHHYYTDPKKMQGAVSCKVDSECTDKVSPASHCDTFNEKCTLPYSERKAKPIVWHYSDGSPTMYYESTREAAEEWDTAMRIAVMGARAAECQRFGLTGPDCGVVLDGNWAEEEDAVALVKESNACRRGETAEKNCDALIDDAKARRNYSDAVVAVAKHEPMVILCHSPVDKTDPEACGKVGTVARLGDLRFNLVTSVATPQTNSPWGIMSDGNDPLTGEKVSSSINIWTHVNDLFSRGLVDTLRYISGELKTEDITDGKYVNAWVEAARSQAGAGLTPLMSGEERDKRIAAVAGTSVESMTKAHNKLAAVKNSAMGSNSPEGKLRAALVENLKKVRGTRAAFDAPSLNAPIYQARANLAKGTPLEAAAVTPAMQQLATAQFGQVAIDQSTKTSATSIFQGLNPAMRRGFEQKMHLALAERGTCIMPFEATAPLGYVALGDILQDKFGKFNPNDTPAAQMERAEKMKDYMRRRAQYAVIAHEMGHSFALRHNFVSSSDAWNFRPQYWALRTNGKQVTKACPEDGKGDGKTCVGPRWLDPVTPNESKNIIHMWAQSSTMEYPGEPTQDFLGLGIYDMAAARMFYGDIATVYAKPSTLRDTYGMDHQDEFGGLLGYRYGDFSSPTHYSQLDATVGLIEKCSTVNQQDFKPANWNDEKDGTWHPMLDGHVVTDESGKGIKCTQPKVNYVQWNSLEDVGDKSHAKVAKGNPSAGSVRVPHGFASDEWADLGNIAVFRHDNGADLYETMQFWIAQQEMTHIFTNYRRGRRDFSIWGAFQRTLGRYHEKMRDSAKAIALYVTLARDTVSLYNAGSDPEGFVAEVLKQVATEHATSSSIAFDHFTHVFSRPQPGGHGKLGDDKTDVVLRSAEGTGFTSVGGGLGGVVLNVANGVQGGYGNISLGGRPIENALARNVGRDYDRDYTLNAGSYYEKAFTAMLFTESADNFISSSRDDFVDPRFRAVSLADVFPDGYRRWIANNLTNDDAIKGVAVRGTGSGTGTSAPDLDPNDFATLGTTSWWPSNGLEYCFPQGERINCRDPFATTAAPGVSIGGIVDPQVGWEQQKFAILFSLLYLPENNRQNWLDQFGIMQLGPENDPGFENRIEFHDVQGRVYIARTFGTEVLFGKTVQKGVAARVLEYANELLQKSVDVDTVKGKTATWYLPKVAADGKITYKQPLATGGFTPTDSCEKSRDCVKLQNYMAVPKFMREAMMGLGWTRNAWELKGVY